MFVDCAKHEMSCLRHFVHRLIVDLWMLFGVLACVLAQKDRLLAPAPRCVDKGSALAAIAASQLPASTLGILGLERLLLERFGSWLGLK